MGQSKFYLAFLLITALMIGLVAGYFYGYSKGTGQGKEDLLAQQQEDTLKEIREMANPFSEKEQVVNPFKTEYENPFEGATVNPFSQ